MKKKQLKKRLTINKETVSHLNNMTMNDIRGGKIITTNCPFIKTWYLSCFGSCGPLC